MGVVNDCVMGAVINSSTPDAAAIWSEAYAEAKRIDKQTDNDFDAVGEAGKAAVRLTVDRLMNF